MSDKNDREFDFMLENTVSDLPPEDIVAGVTPWKKSMHRVLMGLALSGLTLNVWCLNYILPTIGFILMLLGFRTLYRENGWFKGCYGITMIRMLCNFPVLIINATIYQQTFNESEWVWWLTGGNLILQFAHFVCLWQGIKAVQRKADLEEHAGGAVGLMIWYGLICILAGIRYSGLIIALIMIVFYILAIRSLWKLAGEMDEAGYLIEAAPVYVPDAVLAGVIAGFLALGIGGAYLFGSSYHMNWQLYEDSDNEEVFAIKEHLISIGFPEEILDDMMDEDILECKDAIRVAVDINEHPVNDGRRVKEVKKDGKGYVSIEYSTVFDVKELTITGVAVELPGEGEKWKIIHHFRWTEDPGFFGTECIQLWPAHRSGNSNWLPRGWGKASEYTGHVLYDKDGTTYTSPYISLGEETYTRTDIIWGQTVATDVFAEFSLPNEGENQRGYIAYTVEELTDGYLLDAWINYTHQQTWAQYPARTAKEYRMANRITDDDAFKTVQDALQFRPSEGDLKVIGGKD